MIQFGSVRIDGKTCRFPHRTVRTGYRIHVHHSPSAQNKTVQPEIRYRDEHVLVVNKPAGIPVQPTPLGAGNTVAEWVATVCPGRKPHIVHRLDLPVSGLLAIPLSKRMARGMTALFQDQAIDKYYLAVVETTGAAGEASVEALSRDPISVEARLRWVAGKQRSMIDEGGQQAESVVRELHRFDELRHLVSVKLVTGRTHQARAHLGYLGLPVVGDSVYGTGQSHGKRVCLHAAWLSFKHPESGRTIRLGELPPNDFWETAGCDPPPELLNSWQPINEKGEQSSPFSDI